jgi:hypothetical protein
MTRNEISATTWMVASRRSVKSPGRHWADEKGRIRFIMKQIYRACVASGLT